MLRFASWWDATRKVPKNLREADVERYIWGPHECIRGCRGREHRGAGLRETMSDGALNRTLGQVGKFLEWCFRNGYVSGEVIHPATARVRQRQTRRLQLDPDQLIELYEGAKDSYERVICALAAYTGGRAGELNTIRVGDVDLARGEIAWARHKTRRDDDYLPIMSELAEELERWFDVYERECGPISDDWYLVPRRRSVGNPGVMRYYPDEQRVRGCYLVVKKHLARTLGVTEDVLQGEGVHTVRRSVSRCLYEQLCVDRHPDPISVVQALLGHSSRVMTERYIGVEAGRRERDRVLRGRSVLRGGRERGEPAGVRRLRPSG
ncbi:site-specific integrase [Pseudonocardia sp. NPDC049154]|uniref:tyrosine-type recombinase/integrase n=1 Tax=Pseudonocardia sp. NPDC049154 TaxID=3155501 RepID=UPI0033FA7409